MVTFCQWKKTLVFWFWMNRAASLSLSLHHKHMQSTWAVLLTCQPLPYSLSFHSNVSLNSSSPHLLHCPPPPLLVFLCLSSPLSFLRTPVSSSRSLSLPARLFAPSLPCSFPSSLSLSALQYLCQPSAERCVCVCVCESVLDIAVPPKQLDRNWDG